MRVTILVLSFLFATTSFGQSSVVIEHPLLKDALNKYLDANDANRPTVLSVHFFSGFSFDYDLEISDKVKMYEVDSVESTKDWLLLINTWTPYDTISEKTPLIVTEYKENVILIHHALSSLFDNILVKKDIAMIEKSISKKSLMLGPTWIIKAENNKAVILETNTKLEIR